MEPSSMSLSPQRPAHQWDAVAELFPRDNSFFAVTPSAESVLDGSTAHVFSSRAEFNAFLAQEDASRVRRPKVAPALACGATSLIFLVVMAMTFIAALFMQSGALLATSLVSALAASLSFLSAVALGVKSGVDMVTGSSTYRRLSRGLIRPERSLPVYIADTTALPEEEVDVLEQCVGLYNYCAANQIPLSPDQWRALTTRALEDTRAARVTGDPSHLTQTRELIKRVENGWR